METNINTTKSFDLNIEKILEDWEVYHAVREVIANAIDESVLTNTSKIVIEKRQDGTWVIKDFGRGIEHKHLTQNENSEKLSNNNLIGKFGIGLKDALATFNRKGVKVLIKSKHGDIKLDRKTKHGFNDIQTLHALISEPSDPHLNGSEIILEGVTDDDIEVAKNQFLLFSSDKILDATPLGQIVEKKGEIASIYLNGVKVAEEENFLFSYNITSLDAKIRKALNRERSNVGRSAYSERVKLILKSSKDNQVINFLAEDLIRMSDSVNHDELSWIDVQEHAVKNLSAMGKFVFFTNEEVRMFPQIVEHVSSQGKRIIYISPALKEKIKDRRDIEGNPIPEFNNFLEELEDNFEYKFIDASELNSQEKKVFRYTENILELMGGWPKNLKEIRISEITMKDASFRERLGLWDEENKRIIIKRSELRSLLSYSATLVHELVHAISGYKDVTREFEWELTKTIGFLVPKILAPIE